MIVTSSNLATNLLVDLINLEKAQQMLTGYGIEGIELARGVEDEKAFGVNFNNRVTADGLVNLFRAIYEKKCVGSECTKTMLEILSQQEFRSGIPAGLPADIRAGACIANKTGEISVVAHDFFNNRNGLACRLQFSGIEGNAIERRVEVIHQLSGGEIPSIATARN